MSSLVKMGRIAVDWDGTCVVDDQWPGMGEWIPGARAGLRLLASWFEEVVIYTCRTARVELDETTPRDPFQQIVAINLMLSQANMPHNVRVWAEPQKPSAQIYLDNRAILFEGSWLRSLDDIKHRMKENGMNGEELDDSWQYTEEPVLYPDLPKRPKPTLSSENYYRIIDAPEVPDPPSPTQGAIHAPFACQCAGHPDHIADCEGYTPTVEEDKAAMGISPAPLHPKFEHDGPNYAQSEMDKEVFGHVISVSATPPPPQHPNSKRFHELLEQAGRLHDRKQADYGRGDDPFANVRSSEDWGIEGWVGAMVRLNDKVKRLQKHASGYTLSNEGAEDSFMDIAVYALIAAVLYEQDEMVSDEL